MSKHRIRAVHDDDLDEFLRSVGLAADLAAGKVRCWFCGDKVTTSSLAAVVPKSGAIKVICSKPSCVQQLDGTVSGA